MSITYNFQYLLCKCEYGIIDLVFSFLFFFSFYSIFWLRYMNLWQHKINHLNLKAWTTFYMLVLVTNIQIYIGISIFFSYFSCKCILWICVSKHVVARIKLYKPHQYLEFNILMFFLCCSFELPDNDGIYNIVWVNHSIQMKKL